MDEQGPHDAGHLSLLEMVRVLTEIAGPAFTRGALTRPGFSMARNLEEQSFETLEDFVASIGRLDNPIARFEGRAVHYGDGIFGLPACPFASSIEDYREVVGDFPPEYGLVTARINKPSELSSELKMGEGAAVGPLCAVHHPIRSAAGKKIRVAGHRLEAYKLGCKSSTGKRGLAQRYLDQLGIAPERIHRILDENMCCYALRFEPDDAEEPSKP